MWRLYHFTLCPFSRKVRFALAVKGVTHELVQETELRHDVFSSRWDMGNITIAESVNGEGFPNFIAQDPIMLSRSPTWCDGRLEGRHIDLEPARAERFQRRCDAGHANGECQQVGR